MQPAAPISTQNKNHIVCMPIDTSEWYLVFFVVVVVGIFIFIYERSEKKFR